MCEDLTGYDWPSPDDARVLATTINLSLNDLENIQFLRDTMRNAGRDPISREHLLRWALHFAATSFAGYESYTLTEGQ